jgi:hypothetical protein
MNGIAFFVLDLALLVVAAELVIRLPPPGMSGAPARKRTRPARGLNHVHNKHEQRCE